tara:strand:- start:713 stop:823 length:111 start_codon:yes stop_codon:yes gene_type:complete
LLVAVAEVQVGQQVVVVLVDIEHQATDQVHYKDQLW